MGSTVSIASEIPHRRVIAFQGVIGYPIYLTGSRSFSARQFLVLPVVRSTRQELLSLAASVAPSTASLSYSLDVFCTFAAAQFVWFFNKIHMYLSFVPGPFPLSLYSRRNDPATLVSAQTRLFHQSPDPPLLTFPEVALPQEIPDPSNQRLLQTAFRESD